MAQNAGATTLQDELANEVNIGQVKLDTLVRVRLERAERELMRIGDFVPSPGSNTQGNLKTLSNIFSATNGATTLTQIEEFLEVLKPTNSIVLLVEMYYARHDVASLLSKVVRFVELHNMFWLHHLPEGKSVIVEFLMFVFSKFTGMMSTDSKADAAAATIAAVVDQAKTKVLIESKEKDLDTDSDAEYEESAATPQADGDTEKGVLSRMLAALGIDWIIDDDHAPYTVVIATCSLMAVVAAVGSTVAFTVPQFIGVVAAVNACGMFFKNLENIKQFCKSLYFGFQTAVCSILGVSAVFPGTKSHSLRVKIGKLHDLLIKFREGMKKDPAYLITGVDRLYEIKQARTELDAIYAGLSKMDTPITNFRPQLTAIDKIMAVAEGFIKALNDSTSGKQEPVVLWIGGDPGHGKSFMAKHIIKKLEERFNSRLPVFTRNNSDKYWSTYAGHPVVLYDDFGSMADDLDHAELMSLKTGAAMLLNMADLPDKGQRCIPRFVVICSNYMGIVSSKAINTVAPLQRRRDILLNLDSPKYRAYKQTHSRAPPPEWYSDPNNFSFPDDVVMTEWSPEGTVTTGQVFMSDTVCSSPITVDSIVSRMYDRHNEFQKLFVASVLASAQVVDGVQQAGGEEFDDRYLDDEGKLPPNNYFKKTGLPRKSVPAIVLARFIPGADPMPAIDHTVTVARNIAIVLSGAPGIGKTFASEMIAGIFTAQNPQNVVVQCTGQQLARAEVSVVGATHLIIDDITATAQAFEATRAFIMEIDKRPMLKRVICTANHQPFNDYLNGLQSEISDALRRRILRYKYVFNAEPSGILSTLGITTPVQYTRTAVEGLATNRLLYDNIVRVIGEENEYTPSLFLKHIREIQTEKTTTSSVSLALPTTIDLECDAFVLVSGPLGPMFEGIKTLDVAANLAALKSHRILTGNYYTLATFFYGLKDQIVNVKTENIKDDDLMLLLATARPVSQMDLRLLITNSMSGYMIVAKAGRPVVVSKVDPVLFTKFMPGFWERSEVLRARLAKLSRAIFTTVRTVEQDLEIAKIACGAEDLHETDGPLRKFCDVVYFLAKLGVSGWAVYQGIMDAASNKTHQAIEHIKMLLQTHKKQLEAELVTYKVHGKRASELEMTEDVFKKMQESLTTPVDPKTVDTSGIVELDAFIKRDGKWYAKELKVKRNIPVKEYRKEVSKDVCAESCDLVEAELYGKVICVTHECVADECPIGILGELRKDTGTPRVTYHGDNVDVTILEDTSDRNDYVPHTNVGHTLRPSRIQDLPVTYVNGIGIRDLGAIMNTYPEAEPNLDAIPRIPLQEVGVISPYAPVAFSFGGFRFLSLEDGLRHMQGDPVKERQMVRTFLGTYLLAYNNELDKMRPIDKLHIKNQDTVDLNARIAGYYQEWFNEMTRTFSYAQPEASRDTGSLELVRRLHKNVVFIFSGDTRVCTGLVITGPYVLSVRHVVNKPLEYHMQLPDRVITGPLVPVRQFNDDVAIYKMDVDPQCKDLLAHLPSVSEGNNYEKSEATLVITTYDNGVFANQQRDVVVDQLLTRTMAKANVAATSRSYAYTSTLVGVKYQGNLGTKGGDCGSPLIIVNTHMPRKLFAIHCAATDVMGFAVPVYSEMFDGIRDAPIQARHQAGTSRSSGIQVSGSRIVLPSQKIVAMEPVKVDDYETFVCVGMAQASANEQDKTRLWRSPLAHLGPDGPYEPSILSNYDTRMNDFKHFTHLPYYDIMNEAFRKWDHVQPSFDQGLLDTCVSHVIERLILGIGATFNSAPPITKWSMHTAINGDTHYSSGKGLNMSTSVGYPLKLEPGSHSKRAFFDLKFGANGACYYTPNNGPLGRKLLQNYSELLNSVEMGEHSYVCFLVSLKDEVVASKKIYTLPSTRAFAAAPTEFVMVWRRYFGSVAGALTDSFRSTPIKVGINPRGSDWHEFYYQLAAMGLEGFDADFKNWDATVPAALLECVPKVYNALYKRFDPSWKVEDDRVRNAIHRHLQTPLLLCRRSVVEVPGGQVSGQPGTSIDNCIIQMILFYYIYGMICKKQNRVCLLSEFDKNVHFAVYGDDNIASISPEFTHRFNLRLFVEQAQQLSMECTSSAKDALIYDVRPLAAMTFLSRSFVQNEFGRIVGPLHDRAFIKMYQFVMSPQKHHYFLEPDAVYYNIVHCEEIANMILYEYLLWGREAFNPARDGFLEFFIREGHMANLITFDAIHTL